MNICPECKAGKHNNCNGVAWDTKHDQPTNCDCEACLALHTDQ